MAADRREQEAVHSRQQKSAEAMPRRGWRVHVLRFARQGRPGSAYSCPGGSASPGAATTAVLVDSGDHLDEAAGARKAELHMSGDQSVIRD
jgi:hypothetical protein